jgi:hypothetical protein
MKLIFHIGAHKTGTTAIQSVAIAEKAALNKAGIWYPEGMYPQLPEQHSLIYKELEAPGTGLPALRARLELAVVAAKAHGCHTLFLSGEDLSAVDIERAKRFIETCGDLFLEKHFILVLRSKRHYFGSHYNHTLKYGQQVFCQDFPKYIQFSPSKVVGIWRHLCGPSSVKVMSYSGEGPLVSRFYKDLFGFEVPDPKRYEGVNTSIDFLSAFVMNAVLKNESTFDPNRFLRIYSDIFGKRKFDLPISDLVANQISDLYPQSDWIVDGVNWDVLSASEKRTGALNDNEIADFLTALSEVLAKYASDMKAGLS